MKKKLLYVLLVIMLFGIGAGCGLVHWLRDDELESCARLALSGLRPLAEERKDRFLGKVQEDTAKCRGGLKAVASRALPWVDWTNYYATGDLGSLSPDTDRTKGHLNPNGRGRDGALLDLEYQRMELIKFNAFDNSGTFQEYITGRDGTVGPSLKVWKEMRLPPGHPSYSAVGGDAEQLCKGELIRFRNLNGICNDIRNPLMGSTGTLFARNVQFDVTFPDLGKDEFARNRHGDRLGLLTPDPQVISRRLFTRQQSRPDKCNDGFGLPGFSPDANCDYQKAPFFNVLAAFWIQFMTHDWFSHMVEGHNQPEMMKVGCDKPEDATKFGCRPDDQIDKGYVADSTDPATFTHNGKSYLTRAYRTARNNNTAWWDVSQINGYDETARRRVKRDPKDKAKLLLVAKRASAGDEMGYLPVFEANDPINPQWAGQEAAAFPDNWTIGVSFFHNVFAREHNLFVDAFRKQVAATPEADSGLRNPAKPDKVIRYKHVTPDELFEAARLVMAAEIAKIHTIEWTTQLLYDEPLFLAMNANWSGLFKNNQLVADALEQVMGHIRNERHNKDANQWYSVFASGPGIFGLGNHVYSDDPIFAKFDPAKMDIWDVQNPNHVNGGINHFGSPFNFPEEFITVYRLHTLVPDLIEYRQWNGNPNAIVNKIPVIETLRGKATQEMADRGLANWALSMGRQRLGALGLQNSPLFLQNLSMPRLNSATNKIDVLALDLIRDREHGVPRFNEFRRQYGLRQLTSFDDFISQGEITADVRETQQRLAKTLREIYGQHKCDASKIITLSQVNADGSPINDCHGFPNGTMVDNIEDVDTVIGWLAESTRPHGFAISETQFQVFILNASRRLFSDRFFTSSFRPEFYTKLGYEWVMNNGPDGRVMEKGNPNGHEMEVSPLKRVLMRTIPELRPELEQVVNAFDPWARDRGQYYSLNWKPRAGAESDDAFKGSK